MKKILATILFSASLISFFPHPTQAALSQTEIDLCTSSGNVVDNGKCVPKNNGTQLTGPNSYLTSIINLLLYIAGAVAVIVIIVGGIRYITSTGDAMRIKQAKDTILYGIVGLVIALIAYAIVNTLVNQLGGQ